VRLSKFGTFRLRKAAARTFRNPKTGEPGLSKAFKTMTFSASNKLRKY
jgi:nucleoid DNA-binding protein